MRPSSGNLLAVAAASLAVWLAFPPGLDAQTLALTNYNRQPVGDQGGLQGGAVVARVSDPSALWYNPAGLSGSRPHALTANATVYEASRFDLGGAPLYLNTTSTSNFLGFTLGPEPAADGTEPESAMALAFATPTDFSSAAAFHTPNGAAGVLNPNGTVTMVTTETDQDATAGISLLTASFGKSWRKGRDLLVGAALEAGVLTITARQNTAAQQPFADGFPHLLLVQEQYFYGSENVLRLAGGLQMALGESWRLGFAVKTRSLRLTSSGAQRKLGVSSFDFSADNMPPADGRRFESTLFTDYRAEFNYVLPNQAAFGLAWVRPGQEWELDVLYYGAIGAYPFFTSGELATDTVVDQTTTGTVASSATSDRFSRETNSARAVLNFAAGGRLRLSEHGWWNVGMYTDRSPRNTAAVISGHMDLVGLTTGYSVRRERANTTVGALVLYGTTPNFTTTNFFDPSVNDQFGKVVYRSIAAFVSASLAF